MGSGNWNLIYICCSLILIIGLTWSGSEIGGTVYLRTSVAGSIPYSANFSSLVDVRVTGISYIFVVA